MSANGHEDNLKRYLLGDLAAESQKSVENQLMSGAGDFEELLSAVEDELIDEYVRGDLDGEEKERFERFFLCTTERLRKVAFARALMDYVKADKVPDSLPIRSRKPRPERSWHRLWNLTPAPQWALAMAASLLIALLGGMWLLAGNRKMEKQLAQIVADLAMLEERAQSSELELADERAKRVRLSENLGHELSQRESLEKELAALKDQRAAMAPITVAAVWLAPGLLRGLGEVERVIIPSGTSLVQLQLDLGVDDYESYRAALHEAEGDEIWTQSKIKAAAAGERVGVTLTLPSELLPYGDYYIRLSGATSSGDLELVGRYYFRVLQE